MQKIRLFKPSVGKEELKNIKKVFKKSWLGYGPMVTKFEKKFAKFIGTKYCVGVNSGTAALHLSLLCNDFKRGKKVLLPAITFSATAASVLYCGLKPKFVDIKKEDLTIDFQDLKKNIQKIVWLSSVCIWEAILQKWTKLKNGLKRKNYF